MITRAQQHGASAGSMTDVSLCGCVYIYVYVWIDAAMQAWMTTTSRNAEVKDNFCSLQKLKGGIYILHFIGELQHRFSPESIQMIDELLDQVIRDENAHALITTNEGKFFSNGMDVEYLRKCDRMRATEYVLMFQRLVSKLLSFCIPTIAVITGHAVGAGCLFALAHDYRIMVSTRSYIFMNEVDLGLSLTPGNMSLLQAKLPTSTFQEVVLTGKRYDGTEAAAAGIIHETYPTASILLQKGMNKAMQYLSRNWKREVYHALKMEMFKSAIRELENGKLGYARM